MNALRIRFLSVSHEQSLPSGRNEKEKMLNTAFKKSDT